ncbi:MAG: type IV secretion system protein [Anaplasmataceae bacterium]|nr:type IV secretion system protein [Anaplasmataceae bacterium]
MRLFVALFFICFLDWCFLDSSVKNYLFCANDVYAANKNVEVSKSKSHTLATENACGAAVMSAIISVSAMIVTMFIAYFSVVGAPLGLVLSAAIVAVVLVNITGFACLTSFVRHPVLRYSDGRYKKCKLPIIINNSSGETLEACPSKVFDAGSQYEWPKNAAASSDFIEVCYRQPMGSVTLGYNVLTASGKKKHKYEDENDDDCNKNANNICKDNICTNNNTSQCYDPREIERYENRIAVEKTKESAKNIMELIRAVGNKDYSCVVMKNGDKKEVGGITFYAYNSGSQICADIWGIGSLPAVIRYKIGCHKAETTVVVPLCATSKPIYDPNDTEKIKSYDNSSCFSCHISSICYTGLKGVLATPFPVATTVIGCITDTLKSVLHGSCSNGTTGKVSNGMLTNVLSKLKSIIFLVIALSITFFGYKLMGGAVQGKQDIMMTVIRIIGVYYFTIGGGMSNVYDTMIMLTSQLSDLVVSSGGNQTICNVPLSDYAIPQLSNGKSLSPDEEKVLDELAVLPNVTDIAGYRASKSVIDSAKLMTDYEYEALIDKLKIVNHANLKPWNALDCRMGFYLGQNLNYGLSGNGNAGNGVAIGTAVAASIAFSVGSAFLIIPVLVSALFFGGQIIAAICSLMMMITMVLLVAWFVQIAVVAFLSLTLIVLVSPLFIICIMFAPVKPFFQAWLKQLIAPVVILVILSTYLSLIMTLLDHEFFGNLIFSRIPGTSVYQLDPKNQCDTKPNSSTLACTVESMSMNLEDMQILGIRFTATGGIDDSANQTFWSSALRMVLICFLAIMLADNLMTSLAAELAGVYQADYGRMVKGAGAMLKEGAGAASKAASITKKGAGAVASKIKSKMGGSSSRGGTGGGSASGGDS